MTLTTAGAETNVCMMQVRGKDSIGVNVNSMELECEKGIDVMSVVQSRRVTSYRCRCANLAELEVVPPSSVTAPPVYLVLAVAEGSGSSRICRCTRA
ncbi:hypothetical protein BGW80DRAFT_1276910 [Lactifluus volemus]|nr:hypothetical protein BGW80DRAFT_1276910 [Lactifluus volemus]